MSGKKNMLFISSDDDSDYDTPNDAMLSIIKEDFNKNIVVDNLDQKLIKLGQLIPIKYLDNYNDWLKIIWALKAEGKYEESKIISQRSKKYVENDYDKYYYNKKHDTLTIGTFYYYCRLGGIQAYYRCMSNNETFQEYEDISQSDFSKLFYSLEPNKYILGKSGWYEYNKFNILVWRCSEKSTPASLLNTVTNTLQKHFNNLKNNLKPTTEDHKTGLKLYKSIYKKIGQSGFVKGIIEYLKTLYFDEHLDDKLDKNQNLLCFNDKVYDISLNEFRDVEPTDYISVTTGYNAPEKSNPEIKKQVDDLLFSIFEDDDMIEYFKIITSLSLFTAKMQKCFVHTGTGGNGKGILSNLLKSCIGKYYQQAENTFITTAYKASSPNPTLYNGRNKRAIFVNEPDNGAQECYFNIDLIKTLTGGDEVCCRDLYGTNIYYTPQFSLNIQANHKPDLRKLDKGILRRLLIIPYKFNFVDKPKLKNERQRDYNLSNKINKQEFINEYILMLINKAHEYINTDYQNIKIPSAVQKETDNYLEDNNPIKAFLDLYVERTDDKKDKIKTGDFLLKYNHHPDTEKPLSAKDMIKYMTFNDFEICSMKGYKYYKYLKFNSKYEEDKENALDMFN